MQKEEKRQITPVVALREFFGMKPQQTLQEFVAEIKQLSQEERISLARAACEELGAELITKT